MLNIDGLACTWDFKDRLIAVENDKMRAEYTYDYTDRRITKKVIPKPAGSTLNAQPSTLNAQVPEITIYVDRTYELRPGKEHVKYVWNGETRIARVTTNLNATQRIQRFTLHPGWNILALAVSLPNAQAQLFAMPVQQVFRYNPATGDYHPITATESVPAGTLLRVLAGAAGELVVRGTYPPPAPVTYDAVRNWVLNTRFTPIDLATALPGDASLWYFDPLIQAWQTRLPTPLASASTVPTQLPPGEAVFAVHTATFSLAAADATLDVRFYHQDHLGSSSVMTDATGQLVSESTFYAFGHPRNEHQPRGMKEAYGFTQKERDGESGVSYFEVRYLLTVSGRFLSVDPVATNPSTARAMVPQMLNGYSYCHNEPLMFQDPSGCNRQSLMAPVSDGASKQKSMATKAVEYYCSSTPDTVFDKRNALRGAVQLGLLVEGDPTTESRMRAWAALNAALAGQKEIKVDVTYLLATETILRDQLATKLKAGLTSGSLRLEQGDYRNQGSRYAYGGLDLEFTLNQESGQVTVTAKDVYKWSPDSERVTQCLHKMAQGLINAGMMSEPILTGTATTSLPALGVEPVKRTADQRNEITPP